VRQEQKRPLVLPNLPFSTPEPISIATFPSSSEPSPQWRAGVLRRGYIPVANMDLVLKEWCSDYEESALISSLYLVV
jgi:hypothetical protein